MATYCVNHMNKGTDTYIIGSTAFATCNTAGGTPGKTVALNGFKLLTGATVFIKFAAANTATNPTLNVNQTGAKSITNPNWASGCVRAVTYDGTNWVLGDLPVTEKGAKKVKLTGAVTGEASVDSNGTITVDTTKNHRHPYTEIDNPPTIGNATLTIQKNGTSVGTFTANQTTDKTINIQVTESDTTYTLGTDGNTVTLTPSSGSVQSVTVPFATAALTAISADNATKATYAINADATSAATESNIVLRNIKISTSDSISGLANGDILLVREA